MERIYLYVPFEEKAEVKQLGAHWDDQTKCWYIGADEDNEKFKRWLGQDDEEGEEEYSIVSDEACVASATSACWQCNASMEVISMFCKSGEIDGEPHADFSVSNITSVDDSLKKQLERWPSFHQGYSKTMEGNYFANHCPNCNVLQEDFFLHCDPSGPFFTFEDAESESIRFIPLDGRVQLNGDESFEP